MVKLNSGVNLNESPRAACLATRTPGGRRSVGRRPVAKAALAVAPLVTAACQLRSQRQVAAEAAVGVAAVVTAAAVAVSGSSGGLRLRNSCSSGHSNCHSGRHSGSQGSLHSCCDS